MFKGLVISVLRKKYYLSIILHYYDPSWIWILFFRWLNQRVPKLARISDACSSTDRLGWNVRLGIFLPIPPPVNLFLLLRLRSCGVRGSSISRRMWVWSELSMGATDMSLTALNRPQLFRCSFSSRKKFQTNLLLTCKKCV